jgi:polyisoprenoid-binding protein YceI
MICGVRGLFHGLSGTLDFDPAQPERASVQVRIDATTLTTGVEKRDEHLRSADFLDVANHPELSFRSTRVVLTGNPAGPWANIEGELTIRGITRPVTLSVTFGGGPVKDPFEGKEHIGFTAETSVDKRDFDMQWNADLQDGLLVGNKIAITLDVEFIKAA